MTVDLTRPRPPAPTGFLPSVPAFTLASHCIARATLPATYSVPGEPGAAAFLRDGK